MHSERVLSFIIIMHLHPKPFENNFNYHGPVRYLFSLFRYFVMNVVIIDIKPRFIRMEKSVIYRAFYSKYHPIVVAENGYVHDEMAMSMYIYRRRFVF